MVKLVSLFLVAMVILALFGKLGLPKLRGKPPQGRVADARKCPDCGSYLVGEAKCTCKT